MTERVKAPAEVPEGTTHMGLHTVSTNTDGMEHLHPGNLQHLFKFILFLKNTVILLDRVTHFKKKKKNLTAKSLGALQKRGSICT